MPYYQRSADRAVRSLPPSLYFLATPGVERGLISHISPSWQGTVVGHNISFSLAFVVPGSVALECSVVVVVAWVIYSTISVNHWPVDLFYHINFESHDGESLYVMSLSCFIYKIVYLKALGQLDFKQTAETRWTVLSLQFIPELFCNISRRCIHNYVYNLSIVTCL